MPDYDKNTATVDFYPGDEDDEPEGERSDPNQCPGCWGNLDEFDKCAECDY